MIKLIMNRFDGGSAKSEVVIGIKPELDTTSLKSGEKDIRNVKNAFEELGKTGLNINTSNLNTSIKQLEYIQKTLKAFKDNKQFDISSGMKSLKDVGLMGSLPGGTQKLLGELEKVQSVAGDDTKYNTMMTTLGGMEGVFKTLNDAIKDTGESLKDTSSESDKLADSEKKVDEQSKNTSSSFKSLLNGLKEAPGIIDVVGNKFKALDFTKLVNLWRVVRRVSSGLVNTVKSAADYEESLNLYTMALGKYANKAKEWSDTITEKLMLDPSDVMKYTGAFYNFTKGMNVSSNAAYIMSKNLTQLSYDMASYLNISTQAAQTKLQSAMAGQSRAVATAGVATQLASLQELAYTLGIKKKVSEMTQAEKTYLRYIQIMRSTEQMQGDLGRTMITPANAIRTLKNQVTLLGRAIGQVLTPFIMEAIPYIMAFTNLMTKLAQSIATFFGYKVANVDFSSAVSFEDAEDGITNLNKLGDAAGRAGSKAKNSLAPFDELNQVISSSKSSGSGGVGTGLTSSEWDKLLPQYDMLKDYTDKLAVKAKDLEERLKKVALAAALIIAPIKALKTGLNVLKWLDDVKTVLGKFGISKSVVSAWVSSFSIITGTIVTVITTLTTMKDIAYTATKYLGGANTEIKAAIGGIVAIQAALVTLFAVVTANPLVAVFSAIAFAIMDVNSYMKGHIQAVQEMVENDLYGKLSVSVDQWTSMMKSSDEYLTTSTALYNNLKSNIDNLSTSFMNSYNSIELYGYKVQAAGALTKEETQGMKDDIDTMCNDASNIIKNNTDYALSVWGNSFKGMTDVTEEEQKNILSHISSYGSDQQKDLHTAQDNITQTYKDAIKKRGYLTDDEYKYIKEQLDKIKAITQQSMSENQTNIEYFKRVSADKNVALDKQSYSEFKKALEGYQKDRLETIQRDYNTEYNIAQQMYDNHKISYDEYLNMIRIADQNRTNQTRETAEQIKGYQDSVLLNLLQVYTDLQNETDEKSRMTREEIAGIFKDIKIDDKQLIEMFGKLGINASNEMISNFKEESNKPSSKTALETTGSNIGSFVGGGLFKYIPNVTKESVTGLITGIDKQSKLKTTLNSLDNIGKNIIAGIGAGAANTNNISSSLNTLGSKFLNVIKKQLGIKSPSRLMIRNKIGDYLVQGIEKGMSNELDNNMDWFGDSMKQSIQDSLSDSDKITFGDALQEDIEKVTDAFGNMNDEILDFQRNAHNVSMNASMSINRAVVDSNLLNTSKYGTSSNNASEIIANIVQGNNKSNGVQLGDTIVYIGNDKVYQGQGQYQSRQNDRYGTSVVRI